MFYQAKFVSLIALILVLGLVSPALAQDDAPVPAEELAAAQAVDLDEDVSAESLGVKEQKILPGNPLYFFKNLGRNIKVGFTFNPLKKAELRLKYSNEKLVEAKKLAEEKPERLDKAMEEYQKETDKLANIASKIDQKADDNIEVARFMDKFVDNTFYHQKMIGRIEKVVPAKAYERVKKAKEESLNKISEIGLELASPEFWSDKLIQVSENQIGSEFKQFKNLEVLSDLESRVPEQAKDAIRRAQENSLKRLAEKLTEADQDKKAVFRNYINGIGGNESRHLEIIDLIEREEVSDEIREELSRGKQIIIRKVEDRLKEFDEKNLIGAEKEFFSHLKESGRIENLRVIKEIENNLSPDLAGKISDAKLEVKQKIAEVIEGTDNAVEKERIIRDIKEKFHDVRQFEVLEEVRDVITDEKMDFFQEMENAAAGEMRKEILKAQNVYGNDREKVLGKLSSDNPEHIKLFKDLPVFQAMGQEVLQDTADRVSRRVEFIEEPERLEAFKDKVEHSDVKGLMQTAKPQIFRAIEAKDEALRKRMPVSPIPESAPEPAKPSIEPVDENRPAEPEGTGGGAGNVESPDMVEFKPPIISEIEVLVEDPTLGREKGELKVTPLPTNQKDEVPSPGAGMPDEQK